VNLIKGYPPVFNNKNLTEFVFEASREIFGDSNVKEFEPKMWGEDFAYYGKEIPACFWFLGVKNPINETMPALHNSKINPEEEAMILGTAMMAYSAWKYLEG
jgi:metal-dependent amidase/aminoacylase/carboxypeptidase family protein